MQYDPSASCPVDGRPRRLLLVEDNRGDEELIRELLLDVSAEYELVDVDRLSAAKEALERECFEAALLDLGLPESTGVETLRRFSEMAPGLPVVVLTGLADTEVALQSICVGAQDYLFKGKIDGEQLVRAIRYAVERERIEQSLRESEERYRNLAEDLRESHEFVEQVMRNVANVVFVLDAEGKIMRVNRAAQLIGGFVEEELLDRPFIQFIPPHWHETVVERFRHVLETGEPVTDFEMELLHKNGSLVTVIASAARITFRGHACIVGSAQDITERKQMEEAIRHMAHHDALTGLPNRRMFDELAAVEMAKAERRGKRMALLFIDLDHFKPVNDTLGHEAGDLLLKAVAARMNGSVRRTDTVARIGGDEFTIVLPEIARAQDASEAAQKVLDALRRPFFIYGSEANIGGTIGISLYPDDGADLETLMHRADMAMYCAKERARGSFQFFNMEFNNRYLTEKRFAAQLQECLQRGELVLHYQPQVDLASGAIVSLEALVRWDHPELGLLPPDRFMPLAEESGLAVAIDRWVLQSACALAAGLQNSELPITITVNLSTPGFHHPGLVEAVRAQLTEWDLPAAALDLEITEKTITRDIVATRERLVQLSDLGVGISLDDFGTGYSSLGDLSHMPIDTLKIDRSFVQSLESDARNRATVNALTALAHNMEMRVLAEGVETREQLDYLKRHQCDEAQGFLFAAPVPQESLPELVGHWQR